MGIMDSWRVTEPRIEGEVAEWFPVPIGGYVGIVKGNDGSVYSIKSDDCAGGVDPATITRGVRIRFTPETKGRGSDMETKEKYNWGSAREVSLAR